jgi:hypothetical protein
VDVFIVKGEGWQPQERNRHQFLYTNKTDRRWRTGIRRAGPVFTPNLMAVGHNT